MNTNTLLLLGGAGVGAYFLLTRAREGAAALSPKAEVTTHRIPSTRRAPSTLTSNPIVPNDAYAQGRSVTGARTAPIQLDGGDSWFGVNPFAAGGDPSARFGEVSTGPADTATGSRSSDYSQLPLTGNQTTQPGPTLRRMATVTWTPPGTQAKSAPQPTTAVKTAATTGIAARDHRAVASGASSTQTTGTARGVNAAKASFNANPAGQTAVQRVKARLGAAKGMG